MVSATELHQLMKLPILLDHFQEHKTQKPNLSFLNFLFNHYLNENIKVDDFEKDKQLPFKSYEDCSGSSMLGFLPNQIRELTIKSPYTISKNLIIESEACFISSFLANIWQPPKLA
jgi:hypothetical protein